MNQNIVIILKNYNRDSTFFKAVKYYASKLKQIKGSKIFISNELYHKKLLHVFDRIYPTKKLSIEVSDKDCVYTQEPWCNFLEVESIQSICSMMERESLEFLIIPLNLGKYFHILPEPKLIFDTISIKDFLYAIFEPRPALQHLYLKGVFKGSIILETADIFENYVGDLPIVLNDQRVERISSINNFILEFSEDWIVNNQGFLKQLFLNTSALAVESFWNHWKNSLHSEDFLSVCKRLFYVFETELWDGSVIKEKMLRDFEYFKVDYSPLLKVINIAYNYYGDDNFLKLYRWIEKLYSPEDKPLVSILIPTYNQLDLFKKTLSSAMNQTYPNYEIIVGDDSTNNNIKIYVESLNIKGRKMKYFYHGGKSPEENKFGALNKSFLFKTAKGEYISYLSHDDLIHPEKLRIMVNFLHLEPKSTLVTSHKKCIDENDQPVEKNIASCRRIYNDIVFLLGTEAARRMLLSTVNYIGEPSVPMFRKKDSGKDFGDFKNYRAFILDDQAQWLKLLNKGFMIYLPIPLNYIRIHERQLQKQVIALKMGYDEMLELISRSIETYLEKFEAIDLVKRHYTGFLIRREYISRNIGDKQVRELNYKFLKFLQDFYS